MTVELQATLVQDIGSRKEQEDSIAVYKQECIALADGVGGLPLGKEASLFAVDQAIRFYKLTTTKPRSFATKELFGKRLMESVNRSLIKEKKRRKVSEGMVTTLTVVSVTPRIMTVFHLGDCCLFMLRNGFLTRLTRQDREKDTGAITEWLGDERNISPQIVTVQHKQGDTYLLASDGISDWLYETDIIEGLSYNDDNEGAVEMIQRATAYGSRDNKTIAIIRLQYLPIQHQIRWHV